MVTICIRINGKCIIEYAKESYNINKIAGTFAVDNYGSCRVMEKLGMKYLKDTEYTKLDGSETFKAKTYSKEFIMKKNVMVTGTGRHFALGFNFVLRYLENGDNVIATVRKESEESTCLLIMR